MKGPPGTAAREKGERRHGQEKKVPEDLMGSILGEDPVASGVERISSEPHGPGGVDREPDSPFPAGEGPISFGRSSQHGWASRSTFSKQVSRELDRLRLELRLERGMFVLPTPRSPRVPAVVEGKSTVNAFVYAHYCRSLVYARMSV